MEALILVVTLGGPTMFARIGVMQALNRNAVREFNPIANIPIAGLREALSEPINMATRTSGGASTRNSAWNFRRTSCRVHSQ
jgi:hypothetical protein